MNAQVSAAGALSGLEDLLADMNNLAQQEGAPVEDAVEATAQPQDDVAPPAAVDEPKKGAKGKGKGKKTSGKTKGKKPAQEAQGEPQDAPQGEEATDGAAGDVGAAGAPESAPAQEKPKRVFFGRNRIGRLEYKLGSDLGKFLVLTFDDAELDGAQLQAKHDETKALIKGAAVKVQGRATNLIEFVSGKATRLNPVADTALRLLSKDGKLTTGDKGNLIGKLLSNGNTLASARARCNSTLGMLRLLKVVQEGDKSVWVPNPESTLLAKASDLLALRFTDNEAAIAEDEAREEEARVLRAVENTEQLATVGDDGSASEPDTQEDSLEGLLGDLTAQSSVEGAQEGVGAI